MSPNPNVSAVTPDAAGSSTETKWLIVWPNGDVYGIHTDEAAANSGLISLTQALTSYGVPSIYFPFVKRRRRTITRSAWEDA